MKDTIILYHANCHDGFTAAWCAWSKFGEEAEYIAVRYGDELDVDITGKHVFILDFSYPRAVLEEMHSKAASLLVLDHHVSAQRELDGLPYAQFDMERSGAGMAWDHFHEGPRTRLVDYVEDRDLWRFRLSNSREINAWLQSFQPGAFATWNHLAYELEVNTSPAVTSGKAILRTVSVYVAQMCEHAITMVVDGHRVPVVNAPFHHVSELCGALAENAPFAVAWFQRGDGKFQYSLRSRGDYDVSALAKVYGGGGHAKAAGFVSGISPRYFWPRVEGQ